MRSIRGGVVVFGVALWLCAAARGESLEARLAPLIKAHEGQVAVSVRHLQTGEFYTYREHEPMPTASLIKFPVMIEAYRQAAEKKLALEEPVRLRQEDKVPGSGILTAHFSAGAQFALRDAVRLMIVFSDNTATNLVLDQIGLGSTAATMERLGFTHTKIHSKVFRRETSVFPERSREFGLGSTTAAEMAQLFDLLHQGKLVSAAACEEMRGHLLACDDRDKLAALLPPGTPLAHKSGSLDDVRNDAGILQTRGGPIAICVLTNHNQDKRWTPDNAGNRLCARIALEVYDHFTPRAPALADAATLKLGDEGERVEALQRTLNARLAPAPAISVDGDFGAETQAAVVKFQKSNQLAATGVVGPETWKLLGAPVLEEPPAPEPNAVNGEQLPLAPPDRLDGPPVVSCKAWAVGDAKTGQLLWGAQEAAPAEIASTTKIMTAHVVLTLAAREPAALAEEVRISKRADATSGSTAMIRAGDAISVDELLYGLMLPSGNDAATALAEHFGRRFEPPEGGDAQTDPFERFVAEMNRTARRLEMHDSHFMNPHGLPDSAHRSSARDLLRLAATALQNPQFRKYAVTRQHGARVVGRGGKVRNLVWKNGNRLLEIGGYEGIKTGTTSQAGACLVSAGVHDNDRLIVVVLGATSNDARYIDARNLFRWAWKTRAP